MSKDDAAEWPSLILPMLCHRMEANVVGDEGPTQLSCMLEQQFVCELVNIYLLSRQYIDLPQTQLSCNRIIYVNIKEQGNGHGISRIK